METKKERILVTGGAGFIGTHLCRALAAAGHVVRVLDLVEPPNAVANVQYFQGDAREARDIAQALEDVTTVYHLAAIVSVALCQEQPVESYRTNLLATTVVLEGIRAEEKAREKRQREILMQSSNPIRIVFASSSAVYGNLGQVDHALAESTALDQPISFYAAQKLGSEHAISIFGRRYGNPGFVFRFFNVYGPGQDPSSPYSGVISIFTQHLRENKGLVLNGGGEQTRDFVSVHDVVRGLASVLSLSPAQGDARPINLGSGKSVTIAELAQEIQRTGQRELPVASAPWREGDVRHSCSDIRRAHDVLNWTPRVSLAEGLQELLASG